MLQAIVTGAFQEEGSRFESVLVFAGKQGIGKTRWFSRLLPKGMVYDGCELDIKNKDSVLTALSSAVVELGEIDTTFKKSGMSTLKAFLSKETDKIRKPYARTDSHLPRRNVFVGTVNDIAFLSDETGNRRFWVLHTTKLDYQHNVDMQQLFAQVYELQYLHDEPLYLNDEEIALQESLVDNHRIVDPLEEKLLEVFDFTKPRINYMTSTQILNELNFEATKSESTRMGRILSNRFDLQTKKMNGGYVHYLMPEKISCFTHTDLGQNQVDMGI
jgi:putative DNA primase/helicase